jgi:hypothetical protein
LWTQYDTADGVRKTNLWVKQATPETAGKIITVAGTIGSAAAGVSAFSGVDVSDIPGGSWFDVISPIELNGSGDEEHSDIVIPVLNGGELVFLFYAHSNNNAISDQSCPIYGPLIQRFEKLSTGGLNAGVNLSSLPGMFAGTGPGLVTWTQPAPNATRTMLVVLKPAPMAPLRRGSFAPTVSAG